MRAALTGKKFSDERCKRMSERFSGEKNNRFGMRHSEETKAKMSISAIRRGPTHGHSEDTKQKLRERWIGNTLTKGKPCCAPISMAR
jgi:hypothetical protein